MSYPVWDYANFDNHFDFFISTETIDTTAPVFNNCPQAMSFTVPNSQSTQVVTWTPPTATDDSGQLPVITSSHNPGQAFPVGDTTVIYTARDGSGNQATCTFVIQVSGRWKWWKVVMGRLTLIFRLGTNRNMDGSCCVVYMYL